MLKRLTQTVKNLKTGLSKLKDERATTCNSQRYKDLEVEINIKTNELYDAVNDLNDYIFQVAGVNSYEFVELTRSNGYVMGKGIPKPRTLKLD